MPESRKIAVIGLACRVPGAEDYRRFAQNLQKGTDSVTRLSREELLARGVPARRLDDPRYVPARGMIRDSDMFDNEFFGFSTSDATAMDPQHRLFLMTAWHALEDAGYAAPRLRARAGVFGACSKNSYAPVTSNELKHVINGTADHLSTRVSFKLNLHGPSMTVSTACSSSLVAVTQAAQALLMGQCDIALAGGTAIDFPEEGYVFQEGSILSPDGYCRTFDSKAAGTVPGDGAGVVVLKRLPDAIHDGDVIRAVISGYGLNNDGNDKVGYTAPSVSGQVGAITMAHTIADVRPGDIGYVEAHGTGTALGDVVEVAALRDVFDREAPRGSCALGAVKSSIGHLDAAAGVVGLIKTVLSLEEGVIFPSAHVETPNPALGIEESAFRIPTACEPWPDDRPRRAGVSAFGVGGTNVHLVLEEAPERPAPPPRHGHWPLLVSAKNPESLRLQLRDLAEALSGDIGLPDAAFTLAEGREAFDYRCAVTGDDLGEVAGLLRTAEPAHRRALDEITFSFPADAGATPELVRELARRHPGFHEAWGRCEDVVPALSAEQWDERDRAVAQCAFEYALARMWAAHGIEPTRIVASGLGTAAAAAFTGEIPVPQALTRAAEGSWDRERTGAGEPGDGIRVSMTGAGPVRIDGHEVPGHGDAAGAVVAALAAIWQAGVDVRFGPLFSGGGFSRVPLPGYRFRTRRYWDPHYGEPAAAPTLTDPGVADARAGSGEKASDDVIAGQVMAAWETALGETPDSADADFYDAGGDSLAALEVVSQIEERLGVRLALETVFSEPTPGQLAARVRDLLPRDASEDPPGPEGRR
ncbi:beta-ketoacyl synthase N-terminal-like domain-containing protein [Streptomyces sp. NPDC048191]|uniref:beta-ketoacyl synthase N-terminal-like domain-containing protein n=1 Tax=Streptomyces sp. NPDC048191 TaxID=3155484 RepID=UPI0033DF370E